MTHDDKPKFDIDRVIDESKEQQRQKKGKKTEITLREYLQLVANDQNVAENAAARLLRIVLSYGKEAIPEHERFMGSEVRYNLFSKTLFGLEASIQSVVEHFQAGALNLSTGKQFLLLVGPTGSGKSTFVEILKKALENHEGEVYALKGCPIRENPLNALPKTGREKREEELGVKIEGDLCPVCKDNLMTNYRDEEQGIRWWDLPVISFTFSINDGRGIASFEPTDDKTSDVTNLVGKENIAITQSKGYDDPRAYDLSVGELGKANRGILEGIEAIKGDEKALWLFISVNSEKRMKVHGSTLPHVYLDLVTIGHTNLTEYKRFSANQANEAMHDRIYVINFPYPLRIKDEVKIYRKLIREDSNLKHLKKCHIAPGALELAATFAVLTRLVDSVTHIPVLTKAKLYNGDKLLTEVRDADRQPIDFNMLLKEGQKSDDPAKREGMFGVSSRDVLAALNNAIVKYGNGCLTPLRAIRSLRKVFAHRMGYTPEELRRFEELLADEQGPVMSEYREFVVESAKKAYLGAYGDLADELFERYLDEIELDRALNRNFAPGLSGEEMIDETTGEPKKPDYELIRSIEERAGIHENAANVFRSEVLEYRAMVERRGEKFNRSLYPLLAQAVEKKLLDESGTQLSIVLKTDRIQDAETHKRFKDLYKGLEDMDFCKICSQEILEKTKAYLKN